MDDASLVIPHEDLSEFFKKFMELAPVDGCFLNTIKTRILTSCSGRSVLPDIENTNPTLAATVRSTIQKYSNKPGPDPGDEPIMVEITTGVRLLGTPVGSAAFALEFFKKQVEVVRTSAARLHAQIPDLQTRLRMFTQCVIQKLPHLLAADVMHFLPLDYEAHHWEEWNGHLVDDIDTQIDSFMCTLLSIPSLPSYSRKIAQLCIGNGGLSILDASARAVPDFALTMATAM